MIRDKRCYIQGSGWSSAVGYGFSGSKPQYSYEDADFKYPDIQEYIQELPQRYGRFDRYTKVCFSTAVLALKDADLLQREDKKNIGIIVGSSSGVCDNDISYIVSTQEEKGAYSSPNLFSYTLPNVALGEIAVFFKYGGPTFCVGNDPINPGLEVMHTAISLLQSKQCTSLLVGWVEVSRDIRNKEDMARGSAFSVLSLEKSNKTKSELLFNESFRFEELFEV